MNGIQIHRRGRSVFARLSPWPEVAFYLPVLGIVLRSGLDASRGCYDGRRWIETSQGIVRALEGVGVSVTVEGLDHIGSFDGPAVIVGNHMSTLETFVLPSLIQPVKPMTFVVKESLMRYPVFGSILEARDPIVVTRTNPRQDLQAMLAGGRAHLEAGTSVVVFPQTTRSTSFDASQFNSIGAKLAARAGVPVIPLALRTDACGIGERFKDIGAIDVSLPVRFRFGEPLWPQARGKNAHRRTVAFIEGCLAEWGVACQESSGTPIR